MLELKVVSYIPSRLDLLKDVTPKLRHGDAPQMQLFLSVSRCIDVQLISTDLSGPKEKPLPVDFDAIVVPIIL